MTDNAVKPYSIAISDAALADLKERLRKTRYPDELKDAGTELGSPLDDVRRLATYWAEAFDWRRAESELNQYPHFTTRLQADGFEEMEIHFVHVRGEATDDEPAIPLIWLHGWPGSFYEGLKLIQPLTKPGQENTPVFDLVIPSLPNFGLSEGTQKRGFGMQQHAQIMHKLMLRLGYNEYAVQGGDWGWWITRAMGLHYSPQHVKAQHLSFNYATFPQPLKNPILALQAVFTSWTQRERAGLERTKKFVDSGSGYGAIQSTRPQTIGYALSDSPVALLAWIYEKLVAWTDEYPWTDDEICTWISIYWFSVAGPAASVRLYQEHRANPEYDARLQEWQDVKLGFGLFPRDVMCLPSVWGHKQGNVIHDKYHPRGGHFPSWEKPQYIVDDLRAMFGAGGGARGAVRARKPSSS